MNAPVVSDALLARLPIYAEDTYSLARQEGSGAVLAHPADDPRLKPSWKVRGHLTASDAVFGKGPLQVGDGPVFYGWVLEAIDQPRHYVIAIRGTIGMAEWLKDAEFRPMAHPVAGQVEQGFWSIYATLALEDGAPGTAVGSLAQLLKDAISVTVTGHSLGAALGHLLAFDLAAPERLGSRLQSIQFASPRPGNATFGEALKARIPDHRAYAYSLDLVPKIPFGFGFSPVPGTIDLSAIHPGVRIECSLTCCHHALTYAALIDPASLADFAPVSPDQPFLRCVSIP